MLDGTTPVEIATPYRDVHLRGLRTAQANDVLIVVHGNYPPHRLSRLSETEWSLRAIRFDPPPTYEAGHSPDATLTPGAVSGNDVTLTASASPAFLETDLDRQMQAGEARAVITNVVSATVVEVTVLEEFIALTPIPAGEWTLTKSPVAYCKPNKTGPVGARITLDLEQDPDDEPELITNGNFSSTAGWDDVSHNEIVTGTHTGSASPEFLITTMDLLAAGVVVGQLVRNRHRWQ